MRTMPRPTRPRDPVQLAATIIGLATGEITEADVVADRVPKRRAGGVKGGKARSKALAPERRADIAREAAQARWSATTAASKR